MRIPIITRGTRGVDMKVNPLTLGTGKLRSATNLVFEEGGIKTRPSFKYEKLGVKGQFQGATEYNLAEGISAESFGNGTGIAIVADGKISVGCVVVGNAYSCQGDVNVFPAENYVIFQNKDGATYWWDGANLVKSPATITEQWDDSETDWNEVDLTPPVADIPDCGFDGAESGVTVTFTVLDHVTSEPVEGAIITVYHNGNRAFYGVTDENGKWVIHPVPRQYEYEITKDGYTPQDEGSFVVNAEPSERVWDTCVPPQLIVTGETEVYIRLVPIPEETCFDLEQIPVSDTVVLMTFTNNSEFPRRIYSITSDVELTFDTTFPVVVNSEDSVIIEVTGAASLVGETFTVVTECGDEDLEDVEFVGVEDCLSATIITEEYGFDCNDGFTTEGVITNFHPSIFGDNTAVVTNPCSPWLLLNTAGDVGLWGEISFAVKSNTSSVTVTFNVSPSAGCQMELTLYVGGGVIDQITISEGGSDSITVGGPFVCGELITVRAYVISYSGGETVTAEITAVE